MTNYVFLRWIFFFLQQKSTHLSSAFLSFVALKSKKETQMSHQLQPRLPHLKGSQNQVKHQPLRGLDLVRKEGKNNVVYPKERNQQQGGFSQSPEGKEAGKRHQQIHSRTETKEGLDLTADWARHLRVLVRLLPSDVGTVHLLLQNPNYSDEEDEVHLPGRETAQLTAFCWAGCEMWRRDSPVW